ncbi:hypothetical protein NSK_003755 [Nannochloropsis salina CCMP1776]|uniref:Mitochondrial carrier domain-containing protein n=1 Tax=Nannochloropsis salina CCMP1776 TaxID=1027361 RepID=A0A4D9D3X0_9STRA|nr:hypothetical protein NSK_003755 [Nannochloropsis salina CCMP1776]|eukprot:TFJ84723.1 hypothetical protein NSK_003755 [Nannochloropsis salina CCMP1776]
MAAAAPSSPSPSSMEKPKPNVGEILKKSAMRALGGGISGAAAMGINVGALMWLRTTVNYQYRNGTTMRVALKTLYADGGIPRFYQGLLPALVQGPASRFGDTAANAGVITLLDSFDETKDLPVLVKTAAASATAASWRIFLMPVDTLKTIKQVEGKDGFKVLMAKMKTHGPGVMYHGALAAFAANLLGHYPWFATYNYLQENLPKTDDFKMKLCRNALIGFSSSAISDTVSNSVRVVKVYKQANSEHIAYPDAVRRIIAADGLVGLFGRGLSTKIFANGLQGLVFSVLWKLIDDHLKSKAHM